MSSISLQSSASSFLISYIHPGLDRTIPCSPIILTVFGQARLPSVTRGLLPVIAIPMAHETSSMERAPVSIDEKPVGASHIEQIEGHPGLYEKDGLRIYGDGEDHDHEPPVSVHGEFIHYFSRLTTRQMTKRRIMSLVAMAFLWTGSQIPVYILGGIPPIIYGDLGGLDRWVWFVLANLLALAAVCPFVGSLSDLIGRRWVALMGSAFLVVAMIICGTARNMNQFIGKSCFPIQAQRIPQLTLLQLA